MSRGVRAGVLLIALGLAACATTPLAAPDRISVVYQSWGVVRERWSVARDGDGYSGARNQDTFPITAADFASVSELLERYDQTDRLIGAELGTASSPDILHVPPLDCGRSRSSRLTQSGHARWHFACSTNYADGGGETTYEAGSMK